MDNERGLLLTLWTHRELSVSIYMGVCKGGVGQAIRSIAWAYTLGLVVIRDDGMMCLTEDGEGTARHHFNCLAREFTSDLVPNP